MTFASYQIGPCTHPTIRHDNGFLDKFQRREPSFGERAQRSAWGAALEAAEAAQGLAGPSWGDLPDALAAYRHFLEGNGVTRRFSYERYVAGDPSGKVALKSAIFEMQVAAWQLYQRYHDGEELTFQVAGGAIPVGGGHASFPYPRTQNWQKAIGSHFIWLCGKVTVRQVSGQPRFKVEMTLHAEDMYNFNPGAHDITSGIPDSANGVFEITGLAQQYLNVSELTRQFEWSGRPDAAGVAATGEPGSRQRRPADNRRLRNRL